MIYYIGDKKTGKKLHFVFVQDTDDEVVEVLPANLYRKLRNKIEIRTEIGEIPDDLLVKLKECHPDLDYKPSNDTMYLDIYDRAVLAKVSIAANSLKKVIRYIVKVKCRNKDGESMVQNIGVGFTIGKSWNSLEFLCFKNQVKMVDFNGFILRASKISGWLPLGHKSDYIVLDSWCPFNYIKQVFFESKVDFIKPFFDGEILDIKDLGLSWSVEAVVRNDLMLR